LSQINMAVRRARHKLQIATPRKNSHPWPRFRRKASCCAQSTCRRPIKDHALPFHDAVVQRRTLREIAATPRRLAREVRGEASDYYVAVALTLG
jgi:hypothetical protein